MKLTPTEEQLMNYIWKTDKAFMKDILEAYPSPKPAVTTVATLLKRLQEKGVVAYRLYGNSREYYPLLHKRDYFSNKIKNMVSQFFDNSPHQFASFFTKENDMNQHELEDLRNLIDQLIKEKKK